MCELFTKKMLITLPVWIFIRVLTELSNRYFINYIIYSLDSRNPWAKLKLRSKGKARARMSTGIYYYLIFLFKDLTGKFVFTSTPKVVNQMHPFKALEPINIF